MIPAYAARICAARRTAFAAAELDGSALRAALQREADDMGDGSVAAAANTDVYLRDG